jgi:hypothetical protein
LKRHEATVRIPLIVASTMDAEGIHTRRRCALGEQVRSTAGGSRSTRISRSPQAATIRRCASHRRFPVRSHPARRRRRSSMIRSRDTDARTTFPCCATATGVDRAQHVEHAAGRMKRLRSRARHHAAAISSSAR